MLLFTKPYLLNEASQLTMFALINVTVSVIDAFLMQVEEADDENESNKNTKSLHHHKFKTQITGTPDQMFCIGWVE